MSAQLNFFSVEARQSKHGLKNYEDALIQQMMDQIDQDEKNFEFQIDSNMIAQMPPDPSERFYNPQLPENYLNLQEIIRIDYLY